MNNDYQASTQNYRFAAQVRCSPIRIEQDQNNKTGCWRIARHNEYSQWMATKNLQTSTSNSTHQIVQASYSRWTKVL